jgi:hypothetical protein
MIEELVYSSKEIPPHLKWQILSSLRMEWPEGFTGPNRLRDWTSKDKNHPISIMLVEKKILISHAVEEQLFIVVLGSGRARSAGSDEVEVSECDAVLWDRGGMHDTASGSDGL